ncbi:hypothetical protein [Guyparkeria sp.]|uniref:hypothetical protein n=1 Tax=Guyparkeria sp. TaxID=2035736 RepID=UPI00397062F2
MVDEVISIPRHGDDVVIDCFNRLADSVSDKSPLAAIKIIGVGNKQYDPLDPSSDKDVRDIRDRKSTLFQTASFSVQGFSLVIHRGGQGQPKSPFTDSIVFPQNNHNSQLPEHDKVELVYIATECLKAFSYDSAPYDEKVQKDSLHESTLNRLERLNERLVEESLEFRNAVERRYEEKQESLEAEFDERKEQEEARISQEWERVEAKLSAVEREKEDLDSRNNTHARRQLRKDLLDEIKRRQEKFELTEGTKKLRIPIGVAMAALAIFFGFMAIYSAIDLFGVRAGLSAADSWLLVFKQLAYSVGFVASVVFYIKWQNKWFERHSNAEFELKQLELDMERASWLVETSLEWNNEKGDSIPQALLESLSKNLFATKEDGQEDVVHPSDQLASALFGSAASLKLRSGDSEMEINPKKLRKSKRSIQVTGD